VTPRESPVRPIAAGPARRANGGLNPHLKGLSMFRKIVSYGAVAGLIVGIPLFTLAVLMQGQPPLKYGVALGYLTMLIALSAVFVAIKRHRDVDLGGVIRFWPAFGMGLGISAVASLFYVVAWEAALAVTGADFAAEYIKATVAQMQAQGATAEAVAQFTAEMEAFKRQYANPLFRVPMTLAEVFPVGVLVSLVSAALLRNSRFLAVPRR
jgi:hypothetical protein